MLFLLFVKDSGQEISRENEARRKQPLSPRAKSRLAAVEKQRATVQASLDPGSWGRGDVRDYK